MLILGILQLYGSSVEFLVLKIPTSDKDGIDMTRFNDIQIWSHFVLCSLSYIEANYTTKPMECEILS
jgi:hypothetical protein